MSVSANSTSLTSVSAETYTATAIVRASTSASTSTTSSASSSTASTITLLECEYSLKLNGNDIGSDVTKSCCATLNGTMSGGDCRSLAIVQNLWTNCVYSTSSQVDQGYPGASFCTSYTAKSSASVQRVAWGMLAVGLAAVVIAA